jgi:RHS repeat-associated protein
VVANASGVIENESDFLPYGFERVYTQNLANQNYKVTGKERDSESGLDNFGARFDSSNLGRFMTPDWAGRPTTVPYAVFGDPQSLNLYGYVRNDPVTLADADGHNWIKDLFGLGSPDPDQYVGLPTCTAPVVAKVKEKVKEGERALDAFNETLGFGKSNCAKGGDCVNALGMAATAVIAAVASGGESEEATLARSETKIANIAKDLADPELIQAAEREAKGGMKVIREDGKLFSHAENKVGQRIGGLDKQVRHLERFIQEHPGLSDSQKERAVSAIRFARDLADSARVLIAPKDPI